MKPNQSRSELVREIATLTEVLRTMYNPPASSSYTTFNLLSPIVYGSYLDTELAEQVKNAISLALFELNPGLYENEIVFDIVDKKTKDELEVVINGVQVEQKFEPLSDKVADLAADPPQAKRSWKFINEGMVKSAGLKCARRVWDNSLNQEYITWTLLDTIGTLGWIKHYNTISPDYMKRVEHTYKPTKEDTEATDWYII